MRRCLVGVSLLAVSLSIAGIGDARAQSGAPTPAAPDDQQTDRAERVKDDVATPASGRRGRPKGVESATSDIEVTGSRLSNGDPTTNVIVITRADIERRGVTSTEDLIRTLPQNLATIGAITNDRNRKGPLIDGRRAPINALTSLGVSAANLGGIGAGNTLVLVNGRRIAGAAGIEDGFVNLNGIPLAAIERVEISQNGASAVYGADAMGGVINFILRKDFTGFSVGGQYEYSNNGANRVRLNGYAGRSWGTGSLSGTVEYSKTLPVVNAKTGYVTEDYSSFFGGNQAYNFRTFTRGLQPGVIDRTGFVNGARVIRGITPRPGLTTRPTAADFITVDGTAAREYIAESAGPETETISGSYALEQNIVGNLKFFSNGLISRTSNDQIADLNAGLVVQLAPGQYYNPFPAFAFDNFSRTTTVNYFPEAEIADGSLVAGRNRNRVTQWSVNAGLTYDFNRDTRLSLIYTRSRTSLDATGTRFGSAVSFQNTPGSATGVTCTNFDLANNRVSGAARVALQAVVDRQCAALTSSDPTIAFNPFRSPTFTGGGSVNAFLYDATTEDAGATLALYEARLNGSVLKLPGGRIQYAIGGEYSDDGVDSSQISLLTGSAQSRKRHAVFGELNIPIFGQDFTLPAMRSLLINVAGRNDTYITTGIVGTEGGVRIDAGGVPIIRKNRFSRFTPAYGFRWEPIRGVAVRGRWSTGFKAPPATQLFSPTGTQNLTSTISNDPLYRCSTDCVVNQPTFYTYNVRQVLGANPNLLPQTSRQQAFTLSLNPSGALSGLVFNVTYNHTRIRNEYASSRDLTAFVAPADILRNPIFYPRDANGKIIQFNNLTLNLAGSDYRSMLYELSYAIDTGFGNFEPSVVVVHNLKAERRSFEGVAPVQQVGFIGGPDRFRINGQLAWRKGDLSATLLGYYTPSYTNDYFTTRASGRIINPQDVLRVSAYTTFDLTTTWQANDRLRINLVGRNIFDAQPPFTVVGGRPYDTARYNVAGRTLSAQATLSF